MKETLCKMIAWWKEHSPGEKILIMLAIGVFLVLGACLIFWSTEEGCNLLGLAKAVDRDGTRTLILILAGIVGLYHLTRLIKALKNSATATKENAKAAIRTAEAIEQGLATERFIKAMDQLASDLPSIRTGGILGLERIADSQEEERENVVRILSARIRELAPKSDKPNSEDRVKRLDIETAVKALARIAAHTRSEKKSELCNLQGTDLRGLYFSADDLSFFAFESADLTRARLGRANLTRARLRRANLTEAFLEEANLTEADLEEANLTKARLWRANLTEAYLVEANLTEADLVEASLTKAFLWRANLTKAYPRRANLTKARLWRANLTEADLEEANLTKAKLWQANLAEVILEDANLTEANLTGVHLNGVEDFSRAILNNVNLSNVQFGKSEVSEERENFGEFLTQEQLDKTYYWTGHPPLNLPEGLNPPPERTPPEENDQDF